MKIKKEYMRRGEGRQKDKTMPKMSFSLERRKALESGRHGLAFELSHSLVV